MKSFVFILMGSLLSVLPGSVSAQLDRVEPPFWWAGMKHPGLQLMVHGDNITGAGVRLEYPGVELKAINKLDNANFLFLDLELAPDVAPGTFRIDFSRDGRTVASYNYELKERAPGSSERQGFTSSDVIYLVMPDRFANGDPSNDAVEGMKEKPDRKKMTGRHGGDLKGIMDHLDYIEDMGFTALWLNPVLENDQPRSSYHGYAITDFYKVDPRFGSNEDYRKLCHMARERGIKVIMDMVFNHCGSEHWWMNDMPSDDWINLYPDFEQTNHRRTVNQDPHASEYDRKLMVEGWFVPSMPDMNVSNPCVANYLIQNSIWWIEYAGLQGIRMDTYPYPDKHMMARWNRRILEEYPRFNIVGEEWSMNPAIISYWQRGQENRDGYEPGLPGLMDFPMQNALVQALLEDEDWNTGLIKIYESLANDFLYPDPDKLVVFPDNHDMSRFYMQLKMDKELFKMGMACILTTRGIPQIFYGTEILMTHKRSNHHGAIRKDFPGGWTNDKVNAFTGQGMDEDERDMQEYVRLLLNWRKYNEIIHKGRLIHFAPENGVYVFFRELEDEMVLVVLNKNDKRTKLKLDRFDEMLSGRSLAEDVISGDIYFLKETMDIPPRRALVLEVE